MCHKHERLFTLDHIETCDALTGCQDIRKWANKLREVHILDWEKEDRLQAIGAFAMLTLHVHNLTA